MMTLRQTVLMGSAWAALDHAIDRGTQTDRDAALLIAREQLGMVAEIETVERAKVAQVPSDLDDNCG